MNASMLLAAALVGILPRVAAIDPVRGPYVSLGAGAAALASLTVTDAAPAWTCTCYVPPPGWAETRSVFFGPGRADLTEQAQEAIAGTAGFIGSITTSRIEVVGRGDPSGTAAQNAALAFRRAQAVAGALIHDGVFANKLDVQSSGEPNPPVPTTPGYKPQDWQVEIVIRQPERSNPAASTAK